MSSVIIVSLPSIMKMKRSIGLALVLLANLHCSAVGRRNWTEIEPYHPMDPYDNSAVAFLFEHDPLRFTLSPSAGPSATPSDSPSLLPSSTPSDLPSLVPSFSLRPSSFPSRVPTVMPSSVPTSIPTLTPSTLPTGDPSETPSDSPTEQRFPPNDPPIDPGVSYFDYNDERGALWGPGYPELVRHNETYIKVEYQNNAWGTRAPPEEWYWNEFDQDGFGPWGGILANKNPARNRCERFGKQSPIDIRENFGECFEHHQIRTRRGDFALRTADIEAQILPNKLRLKFERRPCREINLPECDEPDPPHADFPHNWGGFTDVIHVDFKIPSEHLIYGERFDAEMQIFHLHPSRRRTPTVVAMMKACFSCHNDVLQDVIDDFQITFDNHTAECATRVRRDRKMLAKAHRRLGKDVASSVDHATSWKFSTSNESPTQTTRRLQRVFTPHHEKLVPSIHFFGYEGSLTEPPCSEFVTWFITDVPMEMSFDQLEQLKRIQFNYVDPHCKKTSIHFRESNARPIQDTFGRPVWRCTPDDFLADEFSIEEDDGTI